MNRPSWMTCWFSLLSACAVGCGPEFHARRLVKPRPTLGRIRLALLGSAEKLLRQKRIDGHLRVPVSDDVELDVWLILAREADGAAGAEARGTVLIVHGLWDSKARYFGLGERLARRGFNVVLPDLRAHGRSTGRHVTYGALEKRDLKVLMDRLLADGRASEPLLVFGVSMGAAIAVRYAALEPRCRGVVAVAPFKDARGIVRRSVALMSERKYRTVWARAAEIAGFDPNDTSTTDAAGRLKCPLVVVHGTLDSVVPYADGKAVSEAAGGPRKLIPVPWAGHLSVLFWREAWFAREVAALAQRQPAPAPAGPQPTSKPG